MCLVYKWKCNVIRQVRFKNQSGIWMAFNNHMLKCPVFKWPFKIQPFDTEHVGAISIPDKFSIFGSSLYLMSKANPFRWIGIVWAGSVFNASVDETFQTLILESADAEANRNDSALFSNPSTHVTDPLCPLRQDNPVKPANPFLIHVRTVPSLEAETKAFPEIHRTQFTRAEWPAKVCVILRQADLASSSATDIASQLPKMMTSLSGAQAKQCGARLTLAAV